MELFDKNGCLTDEGLQALQAGGLDELGRLETAEHLSYCDKCMDRYTALLTADALETPPQDDYLVHINWHDQRMEQFMLDSHKLLGWGLIALGALVAYQNILMNTLGDIVWRWGQSSPFFRALYLMMDQLPEVVVCVALIICGAWLVRGPKGRKQKPQNDAEDEDFTEYTAQDAQAEPEAKGFAMPKLSALLGKPVTPDDETEDADDGRDEK